MQINWDEEVTHAENQAYSLTIRTGMSVQLSNRLTALKLLHPAEGLEVYWQIMNLAEQASKMSSTSGTYPNVPEIMHYQRMTSRGRFGVYIIWGIVLTGARKRSQLLGTYNFVMVWEDELEECLERVFDLERVLQCAAS